MAALRPLATRYSSPMPPEPWLRGALPDVAPELMPAAHALMQAREDIERAASGLSIDELWVRPGGAASVGFHLRHVAGSIDRLLTYARGESLNVAQHAVLTGEEEKGTLSATATELVGVATTAIDLALSVIRATPIRTLAEARTVGRAALPSTVLGLLFHIAEHTQRHVGQIVTTAKIVRGLGAGRAAG
jgi:uncharacterized damage-inducible protein DinB